MAKVSPVSIKYMIYALFKAEGPLEKPDVIGAIFGQTEGLLGDAMEMRELQKEGKIGRIEVNLEILDGKSVGEIQVPTALDKSETTIIAAALETIDRIGPTEAKIEIKKIEDVRGGKRDFIIGRADVVNLLRNRVNNVIGMNGTKLPVEIAKLGETKELTLFVDGDRGGELIARNVINNAKIMYVAVAPDGKEVEELAGKEILIALRKKIPVSEYLRGLGRESYSVEQEKKFEGDVKAASREAYGKIKGTRSALLVDGNFDVIRIVAQREVTKYIRGSRGRVYV